MRTVQEHCTHKHTPTSCCACAPNALMFGTTMLIILNHFLAYTSYTTKLQSNSQQPSVTTVLLLVVVHVYYIPPTARCNLLVDQVNVAHFLLTAPVATSLNNNSSSSYCLLLLSYCLLLPLLPLTTAATSYWCCYHRPARELSCSSAPPEV
jgi:hypothetical protein